MNPNLMYGIVKEEPPLEDSYRIPGFEEHRDGIKLVFNSSLFRKTNMTRFPIGSKCLFSTGAKIEEVLGSIKKVHPKISHMLNTELGYELFYLESRLCIQVLSILKENGIVALPIHDAFIVKRDNEELTKKIMKEAFKKEFNINTGVKCE